MKGPEPRPFRILSLDGGGIRGAFIAGFLADIEHRLDCRIADYFDLIAGTSTGAIIAVALALHEPAEKIERFYRDGGPRIFQRRQPLRLEPWHWAKKLFVEKLAKRYGLDYDQLQQSKYEAKELRAALEGALGNRTMEEAKTRLVIPAVDLTRGQTIVFKTPHMPDLFRDRHYRVVDVLMATTAAPMYFPHAVINEGSAYVDGGLWANNPSMVAIAEAMRIREKADRDGIDHPIDLESIHMLSVGTGKASYFAKPPVAGAGAMWWAPQLFNVSSVAQSQGTNFQAHYILGDRLRRIGYDLPDGRWSLDSIEMLAQMAKIGHERSTENLASLRPVFFAHKAQHPWQPFSDVTPALK
jgi:patatin-like phospholipase/acyl hydrolase